MTGGDLQQKVIELAHYYGWSVAHFRSVKTQRVDGTTRYMTPVAADGKGFPDLVLVHPAEQQLLFREIKGQTEVMRREQVSWGQKLMAAGADWAIWRPRDWDDIIVPILTFGKGQ